MLTVLVELAAVYTEGYGRSDAKGRTASTRVNGESVADANKENNFAGTRVEADAEGRGEGSRAATGGAGIARTGKCLRLDQC